MAFLARMLLVPCSKRGVRQRKSSNDPCAPSGGRRMTVAPKELTIVGSLEMKLKNLKQRLQSGTGLIPAEMSLRHHGTALDAVFSDDEASMESCGITTGATLLLRREVTAIPRL